MKKLLSKKLLGTLIAASLANTAMAAQKPPELVIVSGTRAEANEIKIPANIEVITAEDIRVSGASSVSDLLKGHAGIVIQDNIGSNNRGATISMRGFSESAANNILILVDGRKLNNPSLAAPDLGSVSLKDIERIEIINGSAGTLFGEQSSGGVINIITKKPEMLGGFFETTIGNRDHEEYSASVSDKLGNGLSYRVSGNKRLDDNYRDNNEADYANSLANINYEGNSGNAFMEIQKVDDDMRYPGFLSQSAIQEDRKQSFTPDDFANKTTDIYRLGGFFNIANDWQAGGEHTYRDTEGNSSLFGSVFNESTTIKTWNPRINGTTTVLDKSIDITIGYDLQDTEYRYFTNFQQDINDLYGQTIIEIVTDLKLTVGGRHSELSENNRSANQKNDDTLDVYQSGLSYQLNNSSRIFIRRDESFRWANVDENALVMPDTDFLKPQKSVSNELGYEYNDGSWSFNAVAFQIDLSDEIIYDSEVINPNSYFGFGANINLDDSEREGTTLSTRWKINEKWQISANASYTDSEFSSGSFKGNNVPYVAEIAASSTITYIPQENWSLFIQAVYTGNRYAASDYFNSYDKLGGYTSFNANIRYEINNWYSQLRIDNLGNKQYNGFTYAGGGGYPAAEATSRFTMGYQF